MKKIIFATLIPFSLQAQQDIKASIHNFMQAAVNIYDFNGNILVSNSDSILYQESFGYSDMGNHELLNANSVFDIGKMSEQFTAAAVLLLAEQNKLQLTDAIAKYFPDLPYSNVTLHHMITHTSGLPDYYEIMKDKWTYARLATNDDMVKYLAAAKQSLLFEPGSAYDDDFTGYALLASVIEKVSGKSYEAFMHDNIFKPLQLQNTHVIRGLHVNPEKYTWHTKAQIFDERINKFVRPDSLVLSLFTANIFYIIEGITGSTGISSTANDLLAFRLALKTNKLLKATSVKAMTTPYALKDTASKIYNGYGVLVGTNEIGSYILSEENGNTAAGYFASQIQYTNEDNIIIVLSNKANDNSFYAGPIAYLLYNKEVVLPYVHKAITMDSSLLSSYAGKYATPEIVELVKKDNGLYLQSAKMNAAGEGILMLPESPYKIFASGSKDFQFEFEKDAQGNIIKTYVIINGLKKEIEKL